MSKNSRVISLGKGINSIEGASWRFDDNVANSFDKHVRQSIPFYDLIQNYICSLSEWFLKDHSIIYDLGCSTGETAKNIIKFNFIRNINFKYYGLDNSSQMISLAKKKVKSKNVTFIKSDINKFNFKKNSDLFISILVFPFLNLNQRESLLLKIYKSLKIGGSLILVDKCYSDDPLIQDIFNQVYFDSKIKNKLTKDQILNKAKTLRGTMNIYQQKEILTFCKNAGFKKIDIFFKWFNFVGILLVK
jgi:tRNA (cmo5U34)-methyltransferase